MTLMETDTADHVTLMLFIETLCILPIEVILNMILGVKRWRHQVIRSKIARLGLPNSNCR